MVNAQEIQKSIPHRPPFLMLDGVTEQNATQIRGFKNVTANESHFRGHFPDAPVMPGVLVMECLLQLASYFFSPRGRIRLRKVKRLKFRRSVFPGDRLELELNLSGIDGTLEKFRGCAKLEGKVAVEGDFWVEIEPIATVADGAR